MIVALHMSNTVLNIHSKHCGLLNIVVPDLWPLNSVCRSVFSFFYFQCVYCVYVLHNYPYTKCKNLFRASPLKNNWCGAYSVFHLQAFPSARVLSDILWTDVKPALGFNPAGSQTESRPTGGISRQPTVRRHEVTVFYYEYCEMSSGFCGNIIFE